MPLLYQDASEDRRTLRRVEDQKRRLAKEYVKKHGHAPTEAELNQMVWYSKTEPGNGHHTLPFNTLPFKNEKE